MQFQGGGYVEPRKSMHVITWIQSLYYVIWYIVLVVLKASFVGPDNIEHILPPYFSNGINDFDSSVQSNIISNLLFFYNLGQLFFLSNLNGNIIIIK